MFNPISKGLSEENPIPLTLPFTEVIHLGEGKSTPACTSDSSVKRIGIWYSLKISGKSDLVVSSCGEETTNAIAIDGEGDLYGSYACISSFTEQTCEFGTTGTFEFYKSMRENNGRIHVYATDEKINTSVVRFSIYEKDVKESHSICSEAKEITEFPSTQYYNSMYSSSSRRICGETIDGLKGVWYKIKAQENKRIHISTDDVSTFETHIGIYSDCISKLEESWPSECLNYGDSISSPIGKRGTYAGYDMKKDETVFVFVGSYDNSVSGIGRVKFEWKDWEKMKKIMKMMD